MRLRRRWRDMHTCMSLCMYACTKTCNTRMHVDMHTRTCTCIHAHAHAYMHMYMHTRTWICIHAHDNCYLTGTSILSGQNHIRNALRSENALLSNIKKCVSTESPHITNPIYIYIYIYNPHTTDISYQAIEHRWSNPRLNKGWQKRVPPAGPCMHARPPWHSSDVSHGSCASLRVRHVVFWWQ
jgi:hypothetical protein